MPVSTHTLQPGLSFLGSLSCQSLMHAGKYSYAAAWPLFPQESQLPACPSYTAAWPLFRRESQLPACPSYTAAWPLFRQESQLPACPFSAAAWPLGSLSCQPVPSQLQPGLSSAVSASSLYLLCCSRASLSSVACEARLALFLIFRFLNLSSLCSAVSEARWALSRSLRLRNLFSLFSTDSGLVSILANNRKSTWKACK